MTNSQNVANFGFNPPQNNSETIKMNIPDDQRHETHFANLSFHGNELRKIDLKQEKSGKNDAKKGPSKAGNGKGTFWTACSYCYYKYEYEKKFEECCLRCQNCRKPFHAAVSVSRPVPEGFSVKGYSGNSSMVVDISDSDDDEKVNEVKAQGVNDGEGRVVNVMTGKFTFSQNAANAQTIQNNHFINTGFHGNEFKSRKFLVKKCPLEAGNVKGTFWTTCSYCYYKYEYEKKYEKCYMRCQNCRKVFRAVAMAVKGYSGNSTMSEKIRRRNTAKSDDVVEIPDSDDEKKERVMKRVKSVARATKKIAGRGVKTKKIENEVAHGCNEDELEFFEGDDDIFVDLRDI